jgi:hypothetical protein
MGGSITRSPEGRLHTLQTHGQYPTPTTVQEVWTHASRQRYRKDWDGQPLDNVGYRIEWEPRRIACGCGRALGDYVAYRVCRMTGQEQRLEEHGIVEDTSRRYEWSFEGKRDGSRVPRSKQRFSIIGEVGRRARKTTAIFDCRGCGAIHERNLHRLGQRLFESPGGQTFVLSAGRRR